MDTRGRPIGSRTITAAVILAACALVVWLLPTVFHADRTFDNAMKVWELGVLAIGLLSLQLVGEQTRAAAEQARLTAEQIQRTATWNKLLSYHQFFGDLITTEMVKELTEAAAACGFQDAMKRITPMDQHSLDALDANADYFKRVAAYLDEFEEFCGAVHAGVTDSEYAYTLEATRVIRAWIVFEPFISRQRGVVRYSRCYLELERLGSSWKARRETEAQQKNAQDGVKQQIA